MGTGRPAQVGSLNGMALSVEAWLSTELQAFSVEGWVSTEVHACSLEGWVSTQLQE